ncbi:MAG: YdeI/OmpD-associated family protein [Gemmatimonadaceae bacterium]|nr:YdeI/OmpD-associated family protein [Chitinophagaceae bacterium]
MPVKNALYRLFVNHLMMKGGQTALGETADFVILQAPPEREAAYPIPKQLAKALKEAKLTSSFAALTQARKKGILRYLNAIKTEETMQRNIEKLLEQLKNKEKNVRIPVGRKV